MINFEFSNTTEDHLWQGYTKTGGRKDKEIQRLVPKCCWYLQFLTGSKDSLFDAVRG